MSEGLGFALVIYIVGASAWGLINMVIFLSDSSFAKTSPWPEHHRATARVAWRRLLGTPLWPLLAIRALVDLRHSVRGEADS